MKAKELMIGDKIAVRSNDGFDLHIITVSEVKSEGISSGKQKVFFAYDEIEPIPITTEILEKNEFEIEPGKSHDYGYSDEDIWNYGEIITYYPKGLMDRYSKFVFNDDCQRLEIYLNYVHELQNALRLVGKNEMADNLKV